MNAGFRMRHAGRLLAATAILLAASCMPPPPPLLPLQQQAPVPAPEITPLAAAGKAPVYDLAYPDMPRARLIFADHAPGHNGQLYQKGGHLSLSLSERVTRRVLEEQAHAAGLAIYARPLGYLTCEDRAACDYLLFPHFRQTRNVVGTDGYYVDVELEVEVVESKSLKVVATNRAWGRIASPYSAMGTTFTTNNAVALEAIAQASEQLFRGMAGAGGK